MKSEIKYADMMELADMTDFSVFPMIMGFRNEESAKREIFWVEVG